MFITARAIPTGHRSARAGTGRPRRRGRLCMAPVHHFFFLAPAGAFFSFLPPGDGLGVAVWLPAAAAPSSPRQAPPATVSSPCLPPLSPWIPPSPVSSPSLSSPAPQLLSASPPPAVSASAVAATRHPPSGAAAEAVFHLRSAHATASQRRASRGDHLVHASCKAT